MAPKILLATSVSWTSVARLAGAFAEAGCLVGALAPRGALVTTSRYVARTHRYQPLAAIESLRMAIGASHPDLVVPCDDRAVSDLLDLYSAANRAEPAAASIIRRSLGNPENYARIASRSAFIAAARKLGIAALETIPIASEQELDSCLMQIGYPAVLKADGSWGGEGVAIVRNHDEAVAGFRRLSNLSSRWRNFMRAVRRKDSSCLSALRAPQRHAISVQRFVAGKQATGAFAVWQGKVIASLHMDVLVAYETTGPASVVQRIEDRDMEEAARLLAQKFQLSGLHGLDFIRDEKGKVHLIEMNPRGVQASYLPFGPTHDLAAALAACIAPSEAVTRPAITADTVAFFPSEWRRDPASPYLVDGYHDVPWDDPALLRACMGFPGVTRAAAAAMEFGVPGPAAPNPSFKATFAPARHTS